MGMDFTIGYELDFNSADRRKINLPDGCRFSQVEVTNVNSDGSACDSRSVNPKTWLGGEINTPPTRRIKDQLKIIESCLEELEKNGADHNYRNRIQPHIGLPSKFQNLESLKKIQKYLFENFEDTIKITMPHTQVPKPKEIPIGCWLSIYCEKTVSPWRHQFIMDAKDIKDFQMSFFKDKTGKHSGLSFHRQYVNVHSFFKTRSIEGRAFYGSLSLRYIEECIKFHYLFIEQALTDQIPVKEYIGDFDFPPELPFDLELEKGFMATKVKPPTKTKEQPYIVK